MTVVGPTGKDDKTVPPLPFPVPVSVPVPEFDHTIVAVGSVRVPMSVRFVALFGSEME